MFITEQCEWCRCGKVPQSCQYVTLADWQLMCTDLDDWCMNVPELQTELDWGTNGPELQTDLCRLVLVSGFWMILKCKIHFGHDLPVQMLAATRKKRKVCTNF